MSHTKSHVQSYEHKHLTQWWSVTKYILLTFDIVVLLCSTITLYSSTLVWQLWFLLRLQIW